MRHALVNITPTRFGSTLQHDYFLGPVPPIFCPGSTMEYLLYCFLRRRSKSQASAVPSNVDPERQPPLNSEPHSMGMPSNLRASTEGRSAVWTPPESTFDAKSGRGALARSSSHMARGSPTPGSRIEGQADAETRPKAIPSDESAAEEYSHSELHTVDMHPNPKLAVEVPSAPETHLAKFSSAMLRDEAEQLATAPSGSDSDAKNWRCRYLVSERAKNVETTKIGLLDPDTRDWIEVDALEYLAKRNKPTERVQPDYWTEHLNDEERARATEPLREAVIYSDEALREDAHLDIPLQLKHTTTNPVIPSSLADQLCADLGVDGLLRTLNEVLRTSYSADTLGLLPVLQECIEHKYDFGTAFGRLRRFWFGGFEGLPARLAELERKDREMRVNALDEEKGVIKNKRTMPCRMWDLFSNRVLPIWALASTDDWAILVWAISHSWMAEDSRHYLRTSINGFEWRVPLPKDTTLDRLRIELLNLGAEYVWLDVLCLRQEDESRPEMEDTRKREWMLDVPTIGIIYQWTLNVVTYFEGLGRPFHISNIGGERHWLNRAWTLQETDPRTFIGGLTPTSPFPPNAEDLDAAAKQEPPSLDSDHGETERVI
ncbi:hypothetical protein NM688_g6179 [Phlebia brevispora]|uniref:Uncharacterized protein n=1 Tax=Phlebia brevispora TaxID=194682 RepID=A0ACC1SJ14_9APHY|nr:hypothetical protein NM688_g6179 [Phlebia brevispora]